MKRQIQKFMKQVEARELRQAAKVPTPILGKPTSSAERQEEEECGQEGLEGENEEKCDDTNSLLGEKL